MAEHISAEKLAEIGKIEYEKLQKKMAEGELTPKDRMAIPQQEMPSGEPLVRARQMTEVALGYTAEQAVVDKLEQKCMLYDFYGELLTEHQRSIYEDAVFHDLSLSEIATDYGISRQGVHDLIKRCDKILLDYEQKLHLVDRFARIKQTVQQIKDLTDDEKIRLLSDEIIEEL